MAKISERLAEAVPSWGTKVAYGEKTTLGEWDLVPAALVVFGFGGGEGSGDIPEGEAPVTRGEGSGGGGGGYALPIGAYASSPSGVKFLPNTVALLIVAVPLVAAAGLAIARIIDAVKGIQTDDR